MNIDESTIVSAMGDVQSTTLGDEVVVVSQKRDAFCSLKGIGPQIWQMLDEPKSVKAVVDALAEKFDIGRDQCREDVLEFLVELSSLGLVETRAPDERSA